MALSVSKVTCVYTTKWKGTVNNFLTMQYRTHRCSRHSLQYHVKMFSYSPTKIIRVENHLPNTAENITSTFRVVENPFSGRRLKCDVYYNETLGVLSLSEKMEQDRASYSHKDTLHNRNGHSKSVKFFCWSPTRSDLLHCIIYQNNLVIIRILWAACGECHIPPPSYHGVDIIPYPTAFPYGNGMFLHFYQQQESSTTKTVHKVINKGLKAYV